MLTVVLGCWLCLDSEASIQFGNGSQRSKIRDSLQFLKGTVVKVVAAATARRASERRTGRVMVGPEKEYATFALRVVHRSRAGATERNVDLIERRFDEIRKQIESGKKSE